MMKWLSAKSNVPSRPWQRDNLVPKISHLKPCPQRGTSLTPSFSEQRYTGKIKKDNKFQSTHNLQAKSQWTIECTQHIQLWNNSWVLLSSKNNTVVYCQNSVKFGGAITRNQNASISRTHRSTIDTRLLGENAKYSLQAPIQMQNTS